MVDTTKNYNFLLCNLLEIEEENLEDTYFKLLIRVITKFGITTTISRDQGFIYRLHYGVYEGFGNSLTEALYIFLMYSDTNFKQNILKPIKKTLALFLE